MRAALVWVAALAAGACASEAPQRPALRAVALSNAGFETEAPAGGRCPPRWECSAHADPNSFAWVVEPSEGSEGARSLRMERLRNEPWGLISQSLRDPSLRGARVRFSFVMRTEGASGNGAGPFIQAHDGAGRGIGDAKRLEKGTRPWGRVAVEFVVPPNAELLEVGATLEGPGRAWIDAARLEVLESPAITKNPV